MTKSLAQLSIYGRLIIQSFIHVKLTIQSPKNGYRYHEDCKEILPVEKFVDALKQLYEVDQDHTSHRLLQLQHMQS